MGERKGGYYEEMELRRGPWTLEEDTLLIHYIASHGEGRWNLLARCSGLKRTGKSCRLRWLNYLKPDIKRGNLSPEEQLLILELHSKWGNRWSRIAQHLPGRTDNEIKNYWRTRVQKQARQLKIDANSSLFRDALRCYWMPRLLERMGSSCSAMPSLNADATPIAVRDQVAHPDQLPRGQPSSSSTANSSLPYHSRSSVAPPPENRSSPNSTTSASSIFLPHQPPLGVPELPPGSSVDELDSAAAFGSLISDGYCSVINGDHLPPLSALSPSFFSLDHIICNTDGSKDIGDSSMWSMDESCDMLMKSFLNNS